MKTFLTPIRFVEYRGTSQYWLYKCLCGKEKIIRKSCVDRRTTRSCGCYQKQCVSFTNSIVHKTHGEAKPGKRTKEYQTWQCMKVRCLNSNRLNYSRYGGRGIKVCDRWLHSYENFLQDMGRAPTSEYSIDRIDNDGNYCPENCRWATYKEQRANRGNNVYFFVNGRKLTQADVIKEFHVDLAYHIKKKHDLSKLLSVPVTILKNKNFKHNEDILR